MISDLFELRVADQSRTIFLFAKTNGMCKLVLNAVIAVWTLRISTTKKKRFDDTQKKLSL